MSHDDHSGEPLRHHTYDGIQEYDHKLPNWWLWTFYLAIIFAFLYWFSWSDSITLRSDSQRVAAQMSEIEERRFAQMGELDADALWAMSRNQGVLEKGEAIFSRNCVECHGADLKGGIGVNLVDNEWIHGSGALDVFNTISDGAPNGMPEWGRQFGPIKVAQAAAYVLSHHDRETMERAAKAPAAQANDAADN